MKLHMSVVAGLGMIAGVYLASLVPSSVAQVPVKLPEQPLERYQMWGENHTCYLLDTRTGQMWINRGNGGKWKHHIDPPSR